MKFSQLATYLQELEDTTKRLKITSILSELISKLSSEEIDKGLYISLGYLKAEFESEKFNIAEKMMMRVLSQAYGVEEGEVKKRYSSLGDLGSVAEKLSSKNKSFALSINEAHESLMEIAQVEGSGSQEKKISKSAALISQANALSAKYLVRTILGTTRLGFTELTVIDGLVEFLNGGKDKELKKKIEDKYRIHPDIGLIAKKIKGKGIEGIANIKMEVGIPVHAQKAQRLGNPQEVIDKMGDVWLEYKFDGTRVQLHMDKEKKMKTQSDQQEMFGAGKEMALVKTFTRNLEETTHQFPDLIEAAIKQIDARSVILDGEAIAFDRKTGKFLPFQETIQRKRKHGVSDAAKQIPLKYMVFDILYLNGKSLVDESLIERRKLLDSIVKKGETIQVDEHVETDNVEKVAKYHKETLEKGLEGIMVKKINSPYQAGARNFTWVKMKKTEEQILSDTVDCVILGYYHGRGTRAKFGIGGFLVAIWDEKDQKYKTITKVGSGLKDDDWVNLKEMADKISAKEKSKNTDINSKFDCDVWVIPEIVVEIAADELSKSTEHSADYALRFPRMVRIRKDKKPTDTTSPKEIAQMYKLQ